MKKNYIEPTLSITKVELTLMNSFSENSDTQEVTIDPNEEADEFTSRRRRDVWDDEEEEEDF